MNKMEGEKSRKMKVKDLRKQAKGITLIALVITIVVLLILAAVSIATLTGENGILTRANEAKTETEEAKKDELRRLTALEATTNLENKEYKDKNEDTVTIPAGFAVSQVEGEDTIADGLVIIDKNGNEFVWVPVENFDEFEREHFGTDSQKWWTGTFVTDGLSTNNMYEPTSDGEANNNEVEKMYRSVKYNGGFYVGRYEAGKDKTNSEKVVVQKGADVYNEIGWADTDDMKDETGGAVELARNFDTQNEYTSVESTLIYGVQWDAIMRWMKDEPNLTDGKYVQDSTGMGWHSDNSEGKVHQTGIDVDSNKSNCVKNIYDLAGNVYEWTMESYNTGIRVTRGGFYDRSGSYAPASHRDGSASSNSSGPVVGFRVSLYLL